MTVRELMTLLQACDPQSVVILQQDAEGTAYSPLAAVWGGTYEAETPWAGQMAPLTEAAPAQGVPVVCLVPTR